jgi:HEAT repeat protein
LTTVQLVAATRHPVWKVRWDAVNELGLREDPDGIAALAERALHDDNSHPRWRSLWAISAIDRQATDAIPEFISALEDTDPAVVRNAAVALAFFQREEAGPELLKGLEDPDSFRRWEAVFSLSNVGGGEVIAALLTRLDESVEPNTRVRSEVALTLGRIGGPELVPALLGTLKNDSEPGVRMRAVLSLGRIGGPAALEGLRAALAIEKDATVRDALKNAIDDST